ncbi:hypothetical protein DL767_000120 [Monosporascus sp. MG133]|nr:hypothetical protein DL767_000120 [Monosporascus sp. MG133]
MSEDFKVLIIGGSIAGLTLAHCLEKLGLSFEILEQHEEISPQIGASIGILPNGALILDQLGIFEAIEEETEPLELARIRFPDGLFFQSQYPSIIRSNFGYPMSFLERQKLLSILYSKLRHKDRVHTGQKVLSIEHWGPLAVARTAGDKEYSGHLVVGADGVHSIVRSEMWRHVNGIKPGAITDSEKSSKALGLIERYGRRLMQPALAINYACIYGISSGVPGVEDGVQMSLLDYDLTIHAFNGKRRKVFWFVIVKTKKHYSYTDRPHFDTHDARKICESLKSKKLDSTVTFGDMWANCDIFTITPLEEGYFKTWHFGRLVCMGDAVRKLTPNIGQGANMAIEDAAALANALWTGDLPKAMAETAAMEDMMGRLNTAQLARTRRVCRQSEFLTRLQSNDGMYSGAHSDLNLWTFLSEHVGSIPGGHWSEL